MLLRNITSISADSSEQKIISSTDLNVVAKETVMELEKPDLEIDQWLAITGSALLLLIWLGVPFYAQRNLDISAVKVSFAIIVIYYVGFKLWKYQSSSAANV